MIRRAFASRVAVWAVIYAVAVLALGRTRPEVVGANDSSRYSTMIALVEHGTFYIDQVPLSRRTMDKVQIDGRTVSTKPPVLSFFGAGIYAVMHHLFGVRFDEEVALMTRVIVALLCTLPLLLLLLLFHTLLLREGEPPVAALGGTALLGLGTLCFPFATILVNHLPSTAALFAMFFCLRELGRGEGEGAGRHAVLAGVAGGLAVAFELTAIFPVVALMGYLLWLRPGARTLGLFALGALGPAALHLALTIISTGHVLPVQLRLALWHFPGSYWNAPKSWDALQEPKYLYAWNCFFGGRGFFTLTPVLLVGIAGALRAYRNDAQRAEMLAICGGFLALALFIVFRTNNYGGGHYGMRWFLMMVPLWLYLAQPVLRDMAQRPALVALLILLILPGLYIAHIYWFGKPTAYELILMRKGYLVLPP